MKEKGMYGYLDQKRKWNVVKVVINLILVIAVFAAGYLLTETRSNYFTVAAVLLVIPMAYFLTSLVTLWPYRSLTAEQMREFASATGEGKTAVTAYDLVLTVEQKQLYAGAVLFSRKEVVLFTAGKMNLQQKRNELSSLLKSTGYFTGVYLTDNWENFMSRVKADVKADGTPESLDEQYKQKERLLIYSV